MTTAALGRAIEQTARLVERWRDELDDEAYTVFVQVFGTWFDRERGRVRYAVGQREERPT